MAGNLTDMVWLSVAAPALLALAAALLGRWLGKAVAWLVALGPATVLATGVAGVAGLARGGEGAVLGAGSLSWIPGASTVTVGWGMDGLTAVMLCVVGFVALMVVVFSIGYMAEDTGYVRYFALLALFTASMSLLVIADGLVGLFVGWELVGACSYLLIGFWFNKPSAAAAAVKAFLTTRVGDVGLLLGLALLWKYAGALSYEKVFAALPAMGAATVTTVAILLFVGAAGKSAQFPLHIWLPDAMEGPTPVSALIHAATMVAAGVFLVARTWPVFEASGPARMVVLVIGAFTALASATIAVAQTDIKKVLAYSTISQLGFMFAALGAGAWVAAIFHLVTHAAFKALLFLGSGSVIHGSDTQDMREMGGLAKHMPVTAVTWIIGSCALAGVPVFAGFFSKDEVIHAVLVEQPIAGVALLLASLLTAFYITRATRLTFFGTYRGHHHPHEGGPVMTVPLVLLALLAIGLGFAGGGIAGLLGEHGEALDPLTAGISIAVALSGIAAGWLLYRDDVASEVALEGRMGCVWRTLRSAYGFDGFVMTVVVNPTVAASKWLYEFVDRVIIDGSVNLVARGTKGAGEGIRRIQYGDAQWYVALMATGFIMIAVLSILWPQMPDWFGPLIKIFGGAS